MYKEHLGVEMLKVVRGTFTHRHYAKFSVYCYCGCFSVYICLHCIPYFKIAT